MRRLSGFSLMEMMIVLMIVAIIAAVSAPMMSKKAVKSAADGSPWSWVQNDPNESIWYRGNNGTALIGTARRPDGLNTKLYIDNNNASAPYISFGSNGNNIVNLLADGSKKNILFSDRGFASPTTNSVVIGPSASSSSFANIALGAEAAASSVMAVAVGYKSTAGGEESIAIGTRATANFTQSVVIGTDATTNDHGNIAIGVRSNAASEGSIAIGTGATANQNNSVAIGAGVQTAAANEIRLGDANSRVVIPGTLVPNNLELTNLHITGGLVVDGPVVLSNRSGCVLMRENTDRNHPLWLFSSTSGSSDSGEMRAWDGATVKIMGTNYHSDRRLKNVGKSFTAGLAEIKKLEVFNFTFKDDKSKTPRVGVIAQDLQKIFPAAVVKGEDGFLKIRMEDMFYALVNAVKELDNKINSNSKRIEELEKQNAELLKRIEVLENNK